MAPLQLPWTERGRWRAEGGGRLRKSCFFKAKGKAGGDSRNVMKESDGVTSQRGGTSSSARLLLPLIRCSLEILPRNVSLASSFDDGAKVRGGKMHEIPGRNVVKNVLERQGRFSQQHKVRARSATTGMWSGTKGGFVSSFFFF